MYSTLIVIFVVVGFWDSVYGYRGIRQTYPSCKETALCVRLTDCRPYMKLIAGLQRPLSRSVVQYLRRQECGSRCGFDGVFPLVCCFPGDVEKPRGESEYTSPYHPSTTTVTTSMQSDGVSSKNEETLMPQKPDLTPSDLSDYKYTNTLLGEFFETSRISTTTTEKPTTTTRLSKRKTNNNYQIWSLYNYLHPSTTQPPAKKDKRDQMKKKMEAINNAFALSAMDYFFVRRMEDNKTS